MHKRRFSENRSSVQEHQSEQIIARRIADAAKLNGGSGASDMDGNAARVAESNSGEERINLSRSVAILCASLKNGACWEAAT